jgi:hypothetical protein
LFGHGIDQNVIPLAVFKSLCEQITDNMICDKKMMPGGALSYEAGKNITLCVVWSAV